MNYFCFLILLIPILATSQNDKINIEKDFLDFRNLYESNKNEEALEYFSEYYFDVIEREELLKDYDEHTRIRVPIVEEYNQIDRIEKPIKVKGIYYSLFAYSRILVLNPTKSENGVSNENVDNKIKVLKQLFGENYISYDKQTQKTYYKRKFYAYAILKPKNMLNQLKYLKNYITKVKMKMLLFRLKNS